jgi:DNA repair exonuclease SbcCD ATPase subunit
MKIQSLTIEGFQCFGDEPTSIDFDDLTALIGSNGCGKSAALTGLTRLFGTSHSEKRGQRRLGAGVIGRTIVKLPLSSHGNGSLEYAEEYRLQRPIAMRESPKQRTD